MINSAERDSLRENGTDHRFVGGACRSLRGRVEDSILFAGKIVVEDISFAILEPNSRDRHKMGVLDAADNTECPKFLASLGHR